ncbi:MAG: ribosome small subunit-dependent GTPase A [Spirochaetales bacterium]|nr:ribosome small subunit-dependent GTPase A [Spirochaetales bacterium]
METYTGVVTRGINNIYSVIPLDELKLLSDERLYQCRIKGKVLQGVEETYNPLAVGDQVEFTLHHQKEGLITRRLERVNSFERWNAKREMNQTLVANMDQILIITSSDDPPFRPRFLDRAIVCASNTPLLLVLNKCDLAMREDMIERFEHYKELGYQTFAMSAFDEEGIVALRKHLEGKVSAFIGQSGVGKSTIVNALLGGEEVQKVAKISRKYQRGRHTTNHAVMFNLGDSIIVDTPGMREILVPHTDPVLLGHSFPEFRKPAEKCAFQPCLHLHEPDCHVKIELEKVLIHSDRYESYLRMLESITQRPKEWE